MWHCHQKIKIDANIYTGAVLSTLDYLKCWLDTLKVEIKVTHTETVYTEVFKNKLQTI